METTRNKSDEDLGVSSIRQIWRDIINIRSHFNTSDCLTALCFGLGKIYPFENGRRKDHPKSPSLAYPTSGLLNYHHYFGI